ncbi:hypothetical protein CYY_010468 [Polysphondylium violaceum]|uniref:Uncharacterized protein n=1 Tax=Polysphondylium violaceum TaxID=133409 RepID=A0A8J4UZR5_9MYCE|nr:hypothetical protein CYY_010468 [Polysphondylium violaceum]
MSIEQRVKQFYDEAVKISNGTLAITKANKEITTLRKFIHNNQNHNFHEREKAKIFATIELYFSLCNRKKDISPTDTNDKPLSAQDLIEDSLKVPLFTTKQKKSMLKWLEDELLEPNVGLSKQQEKKNAEKKKYYDHDSDDDEYNYDEEDQEEDDS